MPSAQQFPDSKVACPDYRPSAPGMKTARNSTRLWVQSVTAWLLHLTLLIPGRANPRCMDRQGSHEGTTDKLEMAPWTEARSPFLENSASIMVDIPYAVEGHGRA